MTPSNESLSNILIGRICIINTLLEVVLAIMSILTTIGNLLVIVTIYRNPRSEQRTVSNYLVVNLAVADLMIGLLGELLLMISYSVPKDVHEELAYTLMTAAGMVLTSALCLSSGTILSLTIERYLSLQMPLWREKLFTGLPLKRRIILIWIFGLVFGFFPNLIGNANMTEWFHCVLCEFVTLVIIILYMRMFIIIRNFNKHLLIQGIQQSLVQPGHEYITAKRREHLFSKATFLFVGAYVMCYVPYAITIHISLFYDSLSMAGTLENGLFVLMLLNSALNPVLYTFTMPHYRREVKKILDSVKRSVLSLCS